MDFAEGNATFTVSTKSESEQHVKIYGELGSIFIPQPFYNPNPGTDTHIELRVDGVHEKMVQTASNHYTNMADAFAESINNNTPVPAPLSDALANMKIIDAIFASAKNNCWTAVD